MNIIIFAIISIITSNINAAQCNDKFCTYFGNIKFEKGTFASSIPMFFCGYKIPESFFIKNESSKKTTFSIPIHNNQKELYILLADNISFVKNKSKLSSNDAQSGNVTVDKIVLANNKTNFVYHKAVLKSCPTTNETKWIIEKQISSKDINKIDIPQNTLVVLCDPEYASIETNLEKSPMSLPTIVVKNSNFQNVLESSKYINVATVIKAIDPNTVHAKIKTEEIRLDKNIINVTKTPLYT